MSRETRELDPETRAYVDSLHEELARRERQLTRLRKVNDKLRAEAEYVISVDDVLNGRPIDVDEVTEADERRAGELVRRRDELEPRLRERVVHYREQGAVEKLVGIARAVANNHAYWFRSGPTHRADGRDG